MVFVAWKHPSRLVQGTPPGELRLRIVGSSRNGQVIRLSSAKCTVGSAPGCTLRLRAGGVSPVHCLILRGSQGTVVRTWSGHTRLNGEPFADAVLTDGDRLAIGPVELEVLPAVVEAEHSVLDQASHTEVLGRKQPLTPKKTTRRRARHHISRLVAEVRNLRGQLALLRDSWQESASDADRQAAELNQRQQEIDARNAEIAAQLAELASARQVFEQEREAWEHEYQLTRQTLSAEQLAQRATHGEFERTRQNFELQCELLNTELTAAREELTSRQEQLTVQSDEQTALSEQAARLAEQREQIAEQIQRIAEQGEQLAQRRSELEGREVEVARLESEWAGRHAELESRQSSLVESEAGLDRRAAALDERAMAVEQSHDVLDAAATALELSQAVFADERADFEAQRTAGWHAIEQQRLTFAFEADQRQLALDEANREHAGLQVDEAEWNALQERLSLAETELASTQQVLAERERELGERERGLIEREQCFTGREQGLVEREAAWTAHTVSDAEQLAAQREQWQAEQLAQQQSLADARGELEQLRADLDCRQGELAARHAECDAGWAELDAKRISMDAARISIDTMRAELTAATSAPAPNSGEWERQLNELRDELAERQADLDDARRAVQRERGDFAEEREQFEAAIENLQGEVKAFQQIAPEQSATNGQTEQLRAEVDNLTQRLEETDELIEEAKAKLERQRAQIERQSEELEEALAQPQRADDAESPELESLRHKLDRLQASYDEDQQAWQTDLRELKAELRDKHREIEVLREDLEQAQGCSAQDTPEPIAPVILHRLLDDQPLPSAAEPPQWLESISDARRTAGSQTETPSAADLETRRAPSSGGGHEEPSMEEAWAALLTRMRPAAMVIAPPEPGPQKHNKRKSDPLAVDRPVVDERDVTSMPVVDMPGPSGEMLRRSQIVECKDVKAAMRELALTQTRAAIDVHGQKRLLSQFYSKIGLGLACFLVMALLLLVSSDNVLRTASLLGMAVGVYLTGSALLTAKHLLEHDRLRRGGLRAVFEQTEGTEDRWDVKSEHEAANARSADNANSELQGEV